MAERNVRVAKNKPKNSVNNADTSKNSSGLVESISKLIVDPNIASQEEDGCGLTTAPNDSSQKRFIGEGTVVPEKSSLPKPKRLAVKRLSSDVLPVMKKISLALTDMVDLVKLGKARVSSIILYYIPYEINVSNANDKMVLNFVTYDFANRSVLCAGWNGMANSLYGALKAFKEPVILKFSNVRLFYSPTYRVNCVVGHQPQINTLSKFEYFHVKDVICVLPAPRLSWYLSDFENFLLYRDNLISTSNFELLEIHSDIILIEGYNYAVVANTKFKALLCFDKNLINLKLEFCDVIKIENALVSYTDRHYKELNDVFSSTSPKKYFFVISILNMADVVVVQDKDPFYLIDSAEDLEFLLPKKFLNGDLS